MSSAAATVEDVTRIVNTAVTDIAEVLGNMMTSIDERFNRVEAAQSNMGKRLDGVEGRLDVIDGRLDIVDGRLDNIEATQTGMLEEIRIHGQQVTVLQTHTLKLLNRFDDPQKRLQWDNEDYRHRPRHRHFRLWGD